MPRINEQNRTEEKEATKKQTDNEEDGRRTEEETSTQAVQRRGVLDSTDVWAGNVPLSVPVLS